jgi:hypothetical protein
MVLPIKPAGKLAKQSCQLNIESIISSLFVSNNFFLKQLTYFTYTDSDILILRLILFV